MNSWVKTHLKARQTIAMMVVISMLLPMVSWASESSPVSATVEKEFLQKFEANQKQILAQVERKNDFDSDGELIWVYIDPSQDVRYMMKQNRDGDFDFFAQTKKFQKKVVQQEGYTRWTFDRSKWTWETKFNGHRIGVVSYNGKTPVLNAELTSKNIDANLLAARIPHVSTAGTTYSAEGKIVSSAEMLRKKAEEEKKLREFTEISNQCSELVKFDDIRGRGLIQKTFNIERTKSSYSDQQMEIFKDSIRKKYDANDFSSYVMMYSILNISMNTSLYAMMVFREMFLGPKTKTDLQIYFAQPATFGSSTVKNETYRKAASRMISTFMTERAKKPIPSMEGPELDSEIKNFNDNIQKINGICTDARRIYRNTAVSYNGTATLGFMTPKDSLTKYTSDQHFIKIYGAKTEDHLKLMRDSKLGILLFSDSFRKKVGSFDAKACSQDAIGLTTEQITRHDVMIGVDEVRSAFIHLIKDAVEDYASGKPAKVVEKYVQAFPLTVQKAMNFTKSKEDALLTCGAIENIYSDDYWMDKLDIGLMVGGIAAGVICAATGVGVPASAAIMGSFAAADIAAGGVKWAKGYTLENAVRGAGVSGQTEHVQGQEDLQRAKDYKSEGKLQVGFSAAGELGGYFGTKAFIYLRNTYRTKMAREFFKSQDARVIASVESVFTKPKYSQIDSDHIAQVLENAKKTNEYTHVPQKLKALGLDEVDAKEVTRMISQANEERLIFDELQGIITQTKYAGKEKEAIVILHSVAKKGSVMRAGPDLFYNSNERIEALIKARKELIKLGFEPDHVSKMMDELFNENTGALLGKIEKAEVGKFGAYSTRNPKSIDFVRSGPQIQSTVDEAKDLIKYKYDAPEGFFAIREKFKKGGTIQFANGKVFSIKGIYDDTGARNTILELDSGRLLRVPKKQSFGSSDSPSAFIDGHQVLEGAGVPVVKIFENSHDYLVVEKLTNSRNIRNYAHYLEIRDSLPELARQKMDKDFLKFAEKTKNVEYLGDFSAEQIVYSDHRGWVLVDITDDIRVFNGKGNMTVFDSEIFTRYVPEDVYQDAVNAVRKARGGSQVLQSEATLQKAVAGSFIPHTKVNDVTGSDILAVGNKSGDTLELSGNKKYRILENDVSDSTIYAVDENGTIHQFIYSSESKKAYQEAYGLSGFKTKTSIWEVKNGTPTKYILGDASHEMSVGADIHAETVGIFKKPVKGSSKVEFEIKTRKSPQAKELGLKILQTNDAKVAHVDGNWIVRIEEDVYLIKDSGDVFKGQRIGHEVKFSAQDRAIYLKTTEHPYLSVDVEKWGEAREWTTVTSDPFYEHGIHAEKIDEFITPSYRKEGIASGYGDENCSYHSYVADQWLNGGSGQSVLPDKFFADLSEEAGEKIVLASGAKAAKNADHAYPELSAKFYDAELEIVHGVDAAFERLKKMPDMGTAVISGKTDAGGAHVFNVRKEGGRVVFYDFQKALVTAHPDILWRYKNNPMQIVETTQYHLRNETLENGAHYWTELGIPNSIERAKSLKAYQQNAQSSWTEVSGTSPARAYFEGLSGTEASAFNKVRNEILFKPEYSPIDYEKTQDILFRAHNTGSVVEVRPGVFRPDPEKRAALRLAKKELESLGYSTEDANQIISQLSNRRVMILSKDVIFDDPIQAAKHYQAEIELFSPESFFNGNALVHCERTGIVYLRRGAESPVRVLKYDSTGGNLVLTDLQNPSSAVPPNILEDHRNIIQFVDTSPPKRSVAPKINSRDWPVTRAVVPKKIRDFGKIKFNSFAEEMREAQKLGIDVTSSSYRQIQFKLPKNLIERIKNHEKLQRIKSVTSTNDFQYDFSMWYAGRIDDAKGEGLQTIFLKKIMDEFGDTAGRKGPILELRVFDDYEDGLVKAVDPKHIQMTYAKRANPVQSALNISEARKYYNVPPNAKVTHIYTGDSDIGYLPPSVFEKNDILIVSYNDLNPVSDARILDELHQIKPENYRIIKLSEYADLKNQRGKYIVINDTKGRMQDLYALSNYAIVEGPINFFEPLHAGLPTLIFRGIDNEIGFSKTMYAEMVDVALKTNGVVYATRRSQLRSSIDQILQIDRSNIISPNDVINPVSKKNVFDEFLDNVANVLEIQLKEHGFDLGETKLLNHSGVPVIHKYSTVNKFAKEVENFKDGGTIVFKNGKEFRIKGVYDRSGANNAILELDDGRLIRVPKAKRDVHVDKPSAFVRAQKYLKSKGVPVVEIFEHGDDYVVVEKLSNRHGIHNYMDYLSARSDLPADVVKKMDDDLLKFAEKTKDLEYIGDFHPRQLVYSDEKGWVLVDFSEEVSSYTGKGNATVFDRKFAPFIPSETHRDIIKVVEKARMPGSSGLNRLKNEALRNHPNLNPAMVDQAIVEVQEVLNKYPAPMDQQKAVEILEKAHTTGKSTVGSDGKMVPDEAKKRALVKARQDLEAMGYSADDAKFMIQRLADDEVRMLGSSSGEFISSDARHGLQGLVGGISQDVMWNLGNVNANYYLTKFYHALDNLPIKEKQLFAHFFREKNGPMNLAELAFEQTDSVSKINFYNTLSNEEKALMIKLITSVPDDQVLRYVQELIESNGFVPVHYFRELDTLRDLNRAKAMSAADSKVLDEVRSGKDGVKNINKLKHLFKDIQPRSSSRYYGSVAMSIQELNQIKVMIQAPGDVYPIHIDDVLLMNREALQIKSLDQAMMVIDTYHAIEYRPHAIENMIHALVHDPKGYSIHRMEEIDGRYYIYARGISDKILKRPRSYQSHLARSGNIADETTTVSESPATLYFSSLRGEKGTQYEYKMLQFFEHGKYRHNRGVTEKETLDILYHYRERMHSIEAPASARMTVNGVETTRSEIIGNLEIELVQTLVDKGWKELDAANLVRIFRHHDIL